MFIRFITLPLSISLPFQFPFMGKTNPEVFVAVTRDAVYYSPQLPAELVSLLKGVSDTARYSSR